MCSLNPTENFTKEKAELKNFKEGLFFRHCVGHLETFSSKPFHVVLLFYGISNMKVIHTSQTGVQSPNEP